MGEPRHNRTTVCVIHDAGHFVHIKGGIFLSGIWCLLTAPLRAHLSTHQLSCSEPNESISLRNESRRKKKKRETAKQAIKRWKLKFWLSHGRRVAVMPNVQLLSSRFYFKGSMIWICFFEKFSHFLSHPLKMLRQLCGIFFQAQNGSRCKHSRWEANGVLCIWNRHRQHNEAHQAGWMRVKM